MTDNEKDMVQILPEEAPEEMSAENAIKDAAADADAAWQNAGKAVNNTADDADAARQAAEKAVADMAQAAEKAAADAAADAVQEAQETADEAGSKAAEHARKAKQKAQEVRKSIRDWVPGPQLPNQLTIARICMIPLFVALLLWMKKPAGNILAMLVFIIASLTDTADGYIARRYNYITTFGKFMDPLADKLLVCSALICLVDLGRIESWIVIIIIAREFIISGFRLIAVEKGVVIAANIWGKLKTVFQMLMVILMVANFGGFFNMTAQIFKWIALALTLISLITYILKNKDVLKDVH